MTVIVSPGEVWDEFEWMYEDNDVCVPIATNKNITVTASRFGSEFRISYLKISVFEDDTLIQEEECSDSESTEALLEEIYSSYIYSDKDIDRNEQEDDIDLRESDLKCAFTDLLNAILDGESVPKECNLSEGEIVSLLLNNTLSFLHEIGLKIYRPVFLKSKDGTVFFEEYPYDYDDVDSEKDA